ncbi:Uncharacterised protein [Mycobacteroides abscessus subsp. abscessus]|nr:Uncharacterised protein [Mycobacteroides abscessus subsp. abscessus]
MCRRSASVSVSRSSRDRTSFRPAVPASRSTMWCSSGSCRPTTGRRVVVPISSGGTVSWANSQTAFRANAADRDPAGTIHTLLVRGVTRPLGPRSNTTSLALALPQRQTRTSCFCSKTDQSIVSANVWLMKRTPIPTSSDPRLRCMSRCGASDCPLPIVRCRFVTASIQEREPLTRETSYPPVHACRR